MESKKYSLNDNSVWDRSEWEIKTLNVPVLMVENPTSEINIKSSWVRETLPGEFFFLTRTKKYIGENAHKSMLEESMEENEGIWRKLAEK